jgi:hypothetical protein
MDDLSSSRGHLFRLQLKKPIETLRIKVAESLEMVEEKPTRIVSRSLSPLATLIENPPVCQAIPALPRLPLPFAPKWRVVEAGQAQQMGKTMFETVLERHPHVNQLHNVFWHSPAY